MVRGNRGRKRGGRYLGGIVEDWVVLHGEFGLELTEFGLLRHLLLLER